ncbi:hypothetical protein CDO73_06650 [Saccharibacillus sp. O23]|uniref:copper amine oxidase N-terminal domain-containing protein n=1 Tax=Saccharibacillus sp. O23 TaxID=2009338 RepID=UPI000B4E122D|nr:copper amine oxidase N-terminal domain-containing protein [Saccharibacillus sp. O23]OWR31404.1 hypothetical protein CDO73_06650 [Saccharibacillus sp. O23]
MSTKKRKITTAIAAAALTASVWCTGGVSASPAVIQAPGSSIRTDMQTTAYQGRIGMPLSDLAKAIGAELKWKPAAGTLTLRKWNRTYTFKIGSREYDDGMNAGQKPMLLEPVRSIGGRAYIEATFLRVMGYQVDYRGGTLTVAPPLGKQLQETLYRGDLSQARKAVMRIASNGQLLRYEHEPLETKAGETSDEIFLFPQGEALRFYMMYGDTVSLVRFEDGFPVVKAQAHIIEGDGAFKQLFGGRATGANGKFPRIDKPFLTYASHIFGESTSLSSGRVEPDGTYTSLGSEYWFGGQVDKSRGKITYTLDGEKRTDQR